MNRRAVSEISAPAEQAGHTVIVRANGHSYRAGGDIIIISSEIEPVERLDNLSAGVGIKMSETLEGFEGTGYDGRGRHYSVWSITPGGEYRVCSEGDYVQSPKADRIAIGNISRSCNNAVYFTRHKECGGDIAAAFDELGL